jgi:hypothetical protein
VLRLEERLILLELALDPCNLVGNALFISLPVLTTFQSYKVRFPYFSVPHPANLEMAIGLSVMAPCRTWRVRLRQLKVG